MLLLLLTEGQREATILILSREGRDDADDQEAIENELVRRMVIKNVLLC